MGRAVKASRKGKAAGLESRMNSRRRQRIPGPAHVLRKHNIKDKRHQTGREGHDSAQHQKAHHPLDGRRGGVFEEALEGSGGNNQAHEPGSHRDEGARLQNAATTDRDKHTDHLRPNTRKRGYPCASEGQPLSHLPWANPQKATKANGKMPASGGEHPPNFTFMETSKCEACRRRHGRDAKGQKQHLWCPWTIMASTPRKHTLVPVKYPTQRASFQIGQLE